MLESLANPCSIIRVQTWDCENPVPLRFEQVLGMAWPAQTGAVVSGRADVICTGPAEWLVISTDSDAAPLLQQLEEAFEGTAFRATNVSSALARIRIDAPDVRVHLSKGCALDLHPSRFPAGRCARTRFAGMPVILRCTHASTFECIVASSYGDYLISWLNDALGLPFGG